MERFKAWLRNWLGLSIPTPAPTEEPVEVTAEHVARMRHAGKSIVAIDPFEVRKDIHPASVSAGLAMDSALDGAPDAYRTLQGEGEHFIGFPQLAEMATRPEYRRAAETIARHMVRKWITVQAEGDDDKSDRIAELEQEMHALNVRATFQKIAEHDGLFGRSHLFLDFGDWDDRDELKTPIGTGEGAMSEGKVSPKRPLQALKTVEAIWCYPQKYNARDPLAPDWYKPQAWMVMGKEVHCTRLLTFVGREVPDMLKPAYSFGGLSLSQMGRPSVQNWLETRQSVNDIVSAFSVMVVNIDLQEALQGAGEKLFQRIEMFNAQRDNRGLLTIGKEETFTNVSAPLGTLDNLQAQAQEHMASIWGIPIEILNGIQPMGLNASSEGQIRVFYDWIHACQESLFRPHLERVIRFIMLSLWGEIDPDITFTFNDLEGLSDLEKADLQLKKAQTDQAYTDIGAVGADEVRARLAADPDSPYDGLDPDEMPAMPEVGEEPPSPEGAEQKDGWDALKEAA